MIHPGRELTVVELSRNEGKLVQMTQKLLRQFASVTLNHVKGHQDDHVSEDQFPLEARLNIDCDMPAKTKMRTVV